ncbi:hypothetical protein SAMN05428975_4004 [Mucilaginibacter sp. OK268]|jgi:hypothetical protein|uniref:hypothetical protein n=1 Tax=Mucilaginibacter sp. OK268 TaxID=1881048 RepID=UPI00088474EC|nr:hypothetical protein [Mucilaginibacter sp. OK268]SDP94834.1 hypothetical protein SAMN05428975_4004 [Mucilaginibacter sp. OK268]
MNTNEEYLTKRIVIRATRRGMKVASKETMEAMGYNVIAQDGWIVKKYQDGSIEQINPINAPADLGPVTLD